MDTNGSRELLEPRYGCPIEATIEVIGGKWKCVILWWLRRDARSFGELRQLVLGITPKVLTQQLRELTDDGLLHREAYAESPRRVEYSLTPYGETLTPMIELMCEWGKNHLSNFQSGILNLHGLKVLLVSEPELGEFLKSALTLRNTQAITATSAEEAINQLTESRPDILVIDLTASDNQGFEAFQQIRLQEKQQGTSSIAIALTSHSSLDRRQAIRAGFQVHLTKPVELAELVAALTSLSRQGEK